MRLCFLLILRYEIQFTLVPEFRILKQFLRGSYADWVLISTFHRHTLWLMWLGGRLTL
jgi:hypothetical protein